MPNTLSISADVIQTAIGDDVLPGLQDTMFQNYEVTEILFNSTVKGGRDVSRNSKFLTQHAKMRYSKDGDGDDGARLIGAGHFRQGVEISKLINTVTTSDIGEVANIDNSPAENYTQGRWGLTYRWQPIGVTDQQYSIAMAAKKQKTRENNIIDLLEAKIKSSYKTLIETVEDDMIGDNTNPNNGYLSFAAAYAATGTYGELAKATYTGWAGNTGSYTAGNLDDPASAEYFPDLLRGAIRTQITNQASVKNLCLFIEATTADEYAAILQGTYDGTTSDAPGNWRFDAREGAGLPGWEGLQINQVPIVPVTRMKANRIISVDLETTFIVGLRGSLWEMENKWKMGEDSTLHWNRLKLFAQLVSVNPRRSYLYDV